MSSNNRIFSSMIRSLLTILSAQEYHKGLLLELIAHSSSEYQHGYNMFEFQDDYPFQCEEDLSMHSSLFDYHFEKAGELKARGANPHRDPQAVPGQAFRVQGTPLELRPWMMMDKGGRLNPVHPLGEAPIVKGLLIRQQFFRSIAPKTLAQLFKQSLTALEWFRFERWTSITGAAEKSFLRGNVSVYYSPTETKVTDKRCRFCTMRGTCFPSNSEASLPPTTAKMARMPQVNIEVALGYIIRTGPCNLVLSPQRVLFARVVSFMKLLRALCQPPPSIGKPLRWRAMESLCLRSSQLLPWNNPEVVVRLLDTAGKAARLMPRLRVMEIWISGPGFGYLFRYVFEKNVAKVLWRSGGKEIIGSGLCAGSKLRKTWGTVASRRTHRPLSLEVMPFDESIQSLVEPRGSFVYRHLALWKLAFDPVTLGQFEAEITLNRTG